MTTTPTKTDAPKEFKSPKKLSPYQADPFNSRGGKGGKKGEAVSGKSSSKGGKQINVPKFKGGSGGDR